MRDQWQNWEEQSSKTGRGGRRHHHRRLRPQAVRGRDQPAARRDARRSEVRSVDRADPGRAMSRLGVALQTAHRGPGRRRRAALEGAGQALRTLPIRWRILSIATLNIAIALVFTAIIWNGAQVLTAARNELRETRESDRLLALLEEPAGCKASSTAISPSPTPTSCRRSRSCANRCSAPRTAPSWTRSWRLRPPTWCRPPNDSSPASTTCATCRPPSWTPTRTRCWRRRGRCPGSTPSWRAPPPTAAPWCGPRSRSRANRSRPRWCRPTSSIFSTSRAADEVMRKPGADREHHPGHAGPRRQRSAARGAARSATGGAWRGGIAELAQSFRTRARLLSEAVDGNQAAMASMIERLSNSMREREHRL